MLTHPSDPELTLIELADVLADEPPAEVLAHHEVLAEVAGWLREYLCRPHPDLGRSGNVCPYAPAALARGTVYLRVEPDEPDRDLVAADMLALRDWFLELASAAGRGASTYYAFVTVFPDLPIERAAAFIEGVQLELKPAFVEHGTMIGEFHPGPPARRGLWNDAFRPFLSPYPMLGIRHMVGADFPFVEDDDDQVRLYLRRFGDSVPPHLQARVAARTGQSPS